MKVTSAESKVIAHKLVFRGDAKLIQHGKACTVKLNRFGREHVTRFSSLPVAQFCFDALR